MENTKLELVWGDSVLGVHGADFSCLFSARGPESLCLRGKEWIYRPPTPAYWRATTDNDRGSGFPLRSGVWMAADLFQSCTRKAIWQDGQPLSLPPRQGLCGKSTAASLKILYEFTTVLPAVRTTVSYTVTPSQGIGVTLTYHGAPELPEPPVLGWRLVIPTPAREFTYEGLSGETYPDRMAGGLPGVWRVEGLPVTPYLVPQDCGVHMNTRWLELLRDSTLNPADPAPGPFGLRVEATDTPLAFSCLPYTPQELENALHQEELPPIRRTVLTLLGAVRGVGGINSWGADVTPGCRIDASRDLTFSFRILPPAVYPLP